MITRGSSLAESSDKQNEFLKRALISGCLKELARSSVSGKMKLLVYRRPALAGKLEEGGSPREGAGERVLNSCANCLLAQLRSPPRNVVRTKRTDADAADAAYCCRKNYVSTSGLASHTEEKNASTPVAKPYVDGEADPEV